MLPTVFQSLHAPSQPLKLTCNSPAMGQPGSPGDESRWSRYSGLCFRLELPPASAHRSLLPLALASVVRAAQGPHRKQPESLHLPGLRLCGLMELRAYCTLVPLALSKPRALWTRSPTRRCPQARATLPLAWCFLPSAAMLSQRLSETWAQT